MKHIVIGTAGHIDHGKTALIRALTGRDTDRLAEEKRRGITIDLGFTYFDLQRGERAGIIDVPGHERFIRNMTAGVPGMDLVLLVIAADEGIMPQTREHMDILELLGVKRYIIVLTKCDLADGEWIRMVRAEIRTETAGTILEDAPVVQVSSVTGEGIEELRDMIYAMAGEQTADEERADEETAARAGDSGKENARTEKSRGYPRLPVDRVFTIKGAGTVVTGTMRDGCFSEGDELMVYPCGQKCRVREIQVYNERVKECAAGQRAALNLAGIRKEEIRRGCVIAPSGSIRSGRMTDVKLSVLGHSSRTVKNRSRLHFYSGTSEILCRVILLDREELRPGESGYAQLRMESDTALRAGDRFVVRFYSPEETIGGGIVLDADAPREKRFRREAAERLRRLENRDPAERMEIKLREYTQTMVGITCLAEEMALDRAHAEQCARELADAGKVEIFPINGEWYVWRSSDEKRMRIRVMKEMSDYFRRYPYRSGVPVQQIRSSAMQDMKKSVADAYLEYLIQKNILERRTLSDREAGRSSAGDSGKGELLAPAGYDPAGAEAYLEAADRLEQIFLEAGCGFCSLRETEALLKDKKDMEEMTGLMIRRGEIVRLSGDYYTVPRIADRILRQIRERYHSGDIITIIQIKDLFGISRKNAKIILDYLEETGVVKQTGAQSERQML